MNEENILSVIERIILLELSDTEGNSEDIERISLAAILEIKLRGLMIDGDLYRFLDDYDIRRKDRAYRDSQTRKVVDILSRRGR